MGEVQAVSIYCRVEFLLYFCSHCRVKIAVLVTLLVLCSKDYRYAQKILSHLILGFVPHSSANDRR